MRILRMKGSKKFKSIFPILLWLVLFSLEIFVKFPEEIRSESDQITLQFKLQVS